MNCCFGVMFKMIEFKWFCIGIVKLMFENFNGGNVLIICLMF